MYEAASGKLSSPKITCRETQAVCREIKAVIAFVVGRVAQEDTPGGTWGEPMLRGDSRVSVARTTKNAQMLVGGHGTKQGKMRTRSLNRRCGKTV
jgi:hypothetical protein